VPDFSTAFLFSDAVGTAYVNGSTTFDYQKGTITATASGSVAITGSSTSWNTTGKFPLNQDVTYFNLYFRVDPPNGDGIWYPISQFTSDTALTLALPLVNQILVGATYSIAQMPVLQEDFEDMPVYYSLMTYFASIIPDETRFKQYEAIFNNKLQMLKDYAGTKQVSVDLEESPVLTNPNLYPYAQP